MRGAKEKPSRSSPAIGKAPEWYLAFAEWRADIQRRTDAWRTVKFFRQSRSHTILWTEVMRGHYTGAAPGVTDCVTAMPCARMTARKIIALAEQKGFFLRRAAVGDSRKRLLVPSPRCVAEYEAMVDEFLHLAERLGARRPQAANDKDRPQAANDKDRPQAANDKDRPQAASDRDRPQAASGKTRPTKAGMPKRAAGVTAKGRKRAKL